MASTDEILGKLENAAAGNETTESPTGVESKEVAANADDKTETGTKGKGAQDRIQELVARAKAAESNFESAVAKLQAKEAEVGKLIDLAQNREQDAQIVANINELHKNPKYRDLVETLDKALRGVEVEAQKVETPAATTPAVVPANDALAKVQKEVETLRAQASAAIQDQRSDLLLQKSDLVLKELFNQLPNSDYLPKDIGRIQEMLTERIDWDGIEANPSQLETKVAQGFQRTIEEYGDPNGRIAAQAAKQNKETGETKSETVDFTKLPLGKLVKGNDGKERPAIDDSDFSALLAAELKRSQGR
jgi:hypothetical protein